MENINIEFTIKLDKSIYEATVCNTMKTFFNQFVLSHIASDCNFIENALEKMEVEKKKVYKGYVETLKNLKKSIINSVTYEVTDKKENIEEVKVKFNFKYYENTVYSLNKIVEIEIFNQNIKNSYTMSKDIVNLMKAKNKEEEEKLQFTIKLYKHIGDMLEEAKTTVLINDIKLEMIK